MEEILIIKLHNHIRENNPDLLLQLEQEAGVTSYLQEKVNALSSFIELSKKEQPEYIVEEACMDLLTADLKPSRYNYIKNLIGEDFEKHAEVFERNGILQTEIINLVSYCKEIFDSIAFNESNEDDHFIKYTITGAVSEYLESNSEKDKGENELQQPTATEP